MADAVAKVGGTPNARNAGLLNRSCAFDAGYQPCVDHPLKSFFDSPSATTLIIVSNVCWRG
jgi:hypothetical protein